MLKSADIKRRAKELGADLVGIGNYCDEVWDKLWRAERDACGDHSGRQAGGAV